MLFTVSAAGFVRGLVPSCTSSASEATALPAVELGSVSGSAGLFEAALQ